MGRENKKDHIAAVHREVILSAAEVLFLEKGVSSTTIEDISKKSEYSRRTIYAYYESKEDILHQIILKGLTALKENLIKAIEQQESFIQQYWKICSAMTEYHINSPQSANSVNQLKLESIDFNAIPESVVKIFEVGTEINRLLADFIEQGKKQGAVRSDVVPMQTVYILWGCITSLLSLVQNKGMFLEREFQTSKDSFLEYGFKQIINSILEERLSI